MKTQETAENYLETIYILIKELGRVRSIDICNKMNYSKPTISAMMKQFRKNGYVEMDSDGLIQLTNKGTNIAKQMYERHVMIANVLIALGVDEKTAFTDSCKIEHDISAKSFECIKKHYLEYIQSRDAR